MLDAINFENATNRIISVSQNMLEIVWKILFFLLMLVVVANVTSTNIVIVVVLGYVLCVFSYYCFHNFREAVVKIEEWFNRLHTNILFNDIMASNPSAGYIVNNRKYIKINPNGAIPSVGGKKVYQPLGNLENTFLKESILESGNPSIVKTDYKNGELLSPIMKSNSPLRGNRTNRDKLKVNLPPKIDPMSRKNLSQMCGPLGQVRRYNHSNMDLETFMNVNSPGFTSRVVDKAAESASYHVKYPVVRQISNYRFDKSTLRHFSKVPRANSSPAVRIAPPEPTNPSLFHDAVVVESAREDTRKDPFMQVLGDSSRKRNYSQEETDRIGGTPKKSRKSEVKNTTTSQHKRAHEDCSNDSISNKNCKKRCDDADRNYAKMMSYTSSMSVLAPDFCWNSQSKKRKSSKLEKSKNESPEKLEKCRKICEESSNKNKDVSIQTTECVAQVHVTQTDNEINQTNGSECSAAVDETDAYNTNVASLSFDDDVEYIRVAGGKILNRTNCTYRKRLKGTKIDPQSVVTSEPEYYSDTGYIDDKTKKEKLLSDLVNDIEGKGEKTDSVIFYQNSIVEEIEKNVASVEVHEPKTSILTSSVIKPLVPAAIKPSFDLESNKSVLLAATSANSTAPIPQSTIAAAPLSQSTTAAAPLSQSTTAAAPLPQSTTAAALLSQSTITSAPLSQFKITTAPSSQSAIATAPLSQSTITTVPLSQSTISTASLSQSTITTAPLSQSTIAPVSQSTITTTQSSNLLANVGKSDVTAATANNNSNPLLRTPQFSSGLNGPVSFGSSPGQSASVFGISTTTAAPAFGTTTPAPAFGTTTPTSIFASVSTQPSFGVNPATSAPNMPSFGSISSTQPSFGTSNSSMFGNATTLTQPSTFGSGTNAPAVTGFGNAATTTQQPQPSTFGSGTNTPAVTGFGNAATTTQQPQPSTFGGGTNTPAVTGFGNAATTTQQPQPSTFGGGTITPTVIGFGSATTATQQPQPSTFGSGTNTPVVTGFGNVATTTRQPQPSTFGGGANTQAVAGFGNAATITQQPTFGVNAPTFNFGSGSSSLGTVNSFSTARNVPTGEFSFGSGGGAAGQSTGPTFQFGVSNPPVAAAPPSQTFVFGGAAPSTAPSAGGFSIGSGGSNSSRARAVARMRKK